MHMVKPPGVGEHPGGGAAGAYPSSRPLEMGKHSGRECAATPWWNVNTLPSITAHRPNTTTLQNVTREHDRRERCCGTAPWASHPRRQRRRRSLPWPRQNMCLPGAYRTKLSSSGAALRMSSGVILRIVGESLWISMPRIPDGTTSMRGGSSRSRPSRRR
jgi:hypothetical protein